MGTTLLVREELPVSEGGGLCRECAVAPESVWDVCMFGAIVRLPVTRVVIFGAQRARAGFLDLIESCGEPDARELLRREVSVQENC